jgi:hypothetical protein
VKQAGEQLGGKQEVVPCSQMDFCKNYKIATALEFKILSNFL